MNIQTTPQDPIASYHPQSDSEALDFINAWCETCKNAHHDKHGALIRSSCRILHKADQNDEFSKEYPIQWQRDNNKQGICTEYAPQ